MKKLISVLMVFVLFFTFTTPALAASPQGDILPYYINASYVKAELTIGIDGLAVMRLSVRGIPDVTNISVTYYLEREVGVNWYRVPTGTPGNQWLQSVDSSILIKNNTFQLSKQGTYRLTAVFVLTALSSESITLTSEAVY